MIDPNQLALRPPMAQHLKQLVPPPPPGVPSIPAQDVDQEAEMIAAELMGEQFSNVGQVDSDAEKIADEILGIQQNPLPPTLKKSSGNSIPSIRDMRLSMPPEPQPAPAIVSRHSPAKAPAPADQAAPAAPNPYLQFAQGAGDIVTAPLAKGLNNIVMRPLQALDRGVGAIRQIPGVGGVFDHLAAQAAAEGKERAAHPLESAGAALVGIPRGLVGFAEDLGNIGGRISGNGAPIDLRGAFDQIPGAKEIQQRFPASVAGGEAAGVSMIPAHVPGVNKIIANPVTRGIVQGGVGGAVLGGVGSAGAQAKEGDINFGQAAVDAIPTAVIGAGLGAAAGGIAKGAAARARAKEAAAPEAKAATKTTEAATGEGVKLKDGSEFSRQEAIQAVQDPAVPAEVKAEIQEVLAKQDQDIVNLGKEGVAEKKTEAQIIPKKEGATSRNQEGEQLGAAKESQSETAPAEASSVTEQLPVTKEGAPKIEPEAPPGVTRRFNQGATGEAINVKFTDETSAKLSDLGSKLQKEMTGDPSRFDKERTSQLKQELAAQLDMSPEDVSTMAREFNRTVKASARTEFQNGGQSFDAPAAKDFIKEKQRPTLPPREELEKLSSEELNKLDHEDLPRDQQEILADIQMKKIAEEIQAAQEIDKAEQAAAEPTSPRFIVEKTKAGSRIIDNSTGEVIADNKQSLAQNTKRVDQLNQINDPAQLEKELRKGSRDFLAVKKGRPGIREDIFEAGAKLPEGHALEPGLKSVAEAKITYDQARAEYFAAVDAYDRLTQRPVNIKKRMGPKYDKRVEEMTREALLEGNEDVSIEVQNAVKLEPQENAKFKRGTEPTEAFLRVEEASAKMQEAKTALKNARGAIKDQFLAEVKAGNIEQSINIETPGGSANVRIAPKPFSKLETTANEIKGPVPEVEEVDRAISSIRKFQKEKAATDEAYKVASTKTSKRQPRRNQKGTVNLTIKKARNQKGQLDTTGGKKQEAPAEDPTVVALAKGAQESPEISALANDFEKVKSLMTTKNSLDIIKDHSTTLHNDIWLAIGKEATLARKAKFNPDVDFEAIHDSLKMTAAEIRAGGKGGELLGFTPEQLDFLATRREVRADGAKSLRVAASDILEEYGSVTNMPTVVRNRYEVIELTAEAMSPRGSKEGTREYALISDLRSAMYDYIFRWNPAYHGLNLLDPFVVGSSRVGIANVIRAKAALQDASIHAFVRGTPGKDTMRQLKEEAGIANSLPKGVKDDPISSTFRKIRQFNDRLPDIPSERWNLDDSLAAGFILRGDKVRGRGKGVEYLRDLAEGRLSQLEEIEATVEAMQVADELTGSASLGINKNPFQRSTYANSFAQFVSQPIRVTRLLRKYASEGDVHGLLTFTAMNIAFGGRALIPQEAEALKAIPGAKEFIEKLEDTLDYGNAFAKTPVIGRDISDKLRYSLLVPFAGGISSPIHVDMVKRLFEYWEGEKWDKVAKASVLLALSSMLKGGGVEMDRIYKNMQAAIEGDKDIYAVTQTGKFKGKKKFSQITGQKFTAGDALRESILPGKAPKIGEFQKLRLRK